MRFTVETEARREPRRGRRQAIAETAARDARRHGLAAEAAALAGNPAYAAEACEVAELMEQLRGPR